MRAVGRWMRGLTEGRLASGRGGLSRKSEQPSGPIQRAQLEKSVVKEKARKAKQKKGKERDCTTAKRKGWRTPAHSLIPFDTARPATALSHARPTMMVSNCSPYLYHSPGCYPFTQLCFILSSTSIQLRAVFIRAQEPSINLHNITRRTLRANQSHPQPHLLR